MRTIRRDFSKFGNFSESIDHGLAYAFLTFAPGPITQGKVINISTGAMSTIDPSFSLGRNMSVTVTAASAMSFTFTTNPGHVFYPGTISFSANDTQSGVHFGIKLNAQLADSQARLGFALGFGKFEDDSWNHLLNLIKRSCGNEN